MKTIRELETYLGKLVSGGKPPSLSLAVVKNRDIVYSQAFGMADGPKAIHAKTDTVYHWWSMTKIPTAIATLQLHERAMLDIDEPVSNYLRFFNAQYPSPESPEITVRQLLNHTSGLPDTIPAMIGWIHTEDEIYNQTELVRKHLPTYNRLRFEPGSQSAYSNLGYMVLGAIIEEVTGQTYETYTEENILQPMGMTRTHFLYTPEMQQNEAAGSHPLVSFYTPLLPFLLDMDTLVRERIRGTYWFNRIYIDPTPPSGLIGTAEDAARLIQGLMDGEELLRENTKAMMHPKGDRITDRSPGRPLGWAEYGENGRTWFQHRGGGPGFATIMRTYPDESLGIVIFANNTNLNSIRLAELAAGMPW